METFGIIFGTCFDCSSIVEFALFSQCICKPIFISFFWAFLINFDYRQNWRKINSMWKSITLVIFARFWAKSCPNLLFRFLGSGRYANTLKRCPISKSRRKIATFAIFRFSGFSLYKYCRERITVLNHFKGLTLSK